MKKWMKNLYAMLLVVVLIATLLPTSILAAPGRGSGKSKGKAKTQTVTVETPAEETDAESVPEEAEIPAEEPAEEVYYEIEEPAGEEIIEEPLEEIPEEEYFEEPEEEASFLPISIEDMPVEGAEDLLVSIEAPEGAFPTGTEAFARAVSIEDVQNAVDAADDVNGQVVAAVDITFELDGVELQPADDLTVDVKITAKNLIAEAGELDVVHIDSVTEAAESVEAIDVDYNEETVLFEADSFSVYALVWKDASDTDRSATIHWGTYEGSEFTELESPTTIDESAASVKLDVIIDEYYFVGAEYLETEDAAPQNMANTTLKKAADGTWQITLEGNQTVTIADGSHIRVNYAPIGGGGYTPPSPPPADVLAPDTTKTVTANPDGTYTIELDIEGKQDEEITQIGANVIVIMDITQSMTNPMPRPDQSMTRMAAAKRALNTLVTTLDPDTNLINFTAVNFGNSANYSNGVNWTTTKTAMQNYVSGLPNNPTDMGTCWQAGLQGGIDRVQQAQSSASLRKNETYVLFVTDGNPNCYTDTSGNWHRAQSANFNQQAYNAAVANANNLGANSHFYGIFVGDSDGYTHLNNLITNAGGEGTINGVSTTAIDEAFEQIAQTIVDNLGAGSVVVDDGIPTLSNVSANVSAGEAGGFEYYITPKGGSQQVWTEAPGASYSNSNGVTWNLSEAGTLQDGWIYTLKFTVWPSQAAYDLIADLNNGLKDYDDLTEEQKASVTGSKEAGYTLKTNTHLYTTFTDLEGNEYRETNDASAKAMDLPTETISVEKIWHNFLDSRTDVDIDGLQMVLSRDGEEYLTFDVSADTNWKKEGIYISCGQIANGEIKERGHDYYVTEKAAETIDKTAYWEVNSPVYHPMVVDGTMELFIEDDEASDPVFTLDYEENGKTVTHKYVRPTGSTATNLTAINERVSWLNLTKVVTGDNVPADALFTYKVTITEPVEGNEVYFSVRGGGVNYRDDIETTAAKWVDDTTGNTYYRVASGTEFTLKIKAGWNARFLNLDSDSTYSIEEVEAEMADGFVFDTAQTVETLYSAQGVPAQGYPITTTEDTPTENGAVVEGSTVSGTINQTNTDYSVTYTNKYLGCFYVYHSANNEVEQLPMAVNGVKVTGFNIFARTVEGTLYGGYYKDYTGKSEGFDAKALTYTDGKAKDQSGKPYTYAYIKEQNRAAWKVADAYTVSGKAMEPGKDEVYFLKEVPTAYLLPYSHYTYRKGEKTLCNMWYLSAIDDLCYDAAGFFVETFDKDGKKDAIIVDTLTVTNANGGATVKLTPNSVFGNKGGLGNGVQAGYLGYWDASSLIAENAISVFSPFWQTPDKIFVCGTDTRTVKFNNAKVGSGGMRIEDAENKDYRYPEIVTE